MVSQELLDAAKDHIENEPEHAKMRGTGIGDGSHREGVVLNGYETNRWTKHGRDRVYFNDRNGRSYSGHINLETGAVEGETPIVNVSVENIDGDLWTYYYAEVEDHDYRGEELVAAIRR